MGKIYRVMVNGLKGEKLNIDLCNTEEQMKSMTVRQLKEKIAERLPETAGQDYVKLIFTDKMLDNDSDLLSGYGIQHKSVIHMVMKVTGGGCSPGALYRGMGDREGRNLSMENIADFEKCTSEAQEPK